LEEVQHSEVLHLCKPRQRLESVVRKVGMGERSMKEKEVYQFVGAEDRKQA